jgi:uncharacterized protein
MDYPITQQNRVRRIPARGAYDRDTIHAIVDEAILCHVGFVDAGQPYVIPTLHARDGDDILLHGAPASRLLKIAASGAPLCITCTLVDGIVVARSAFHSSMNYRSAVLLGIGAPITDPTEKWAALAAFTEHVIPGRWADSRTMSETEMNATSIVRVTVESASAKVRTGPPGDDEADYALPIWAGVLPLRTHSDAPVADPRLDQPVDVPGYLLNYKRPGQS